MHQRDNLDPLREQLIAALHSDNAAKTALMASRSRDFAKQLVQVCQPYDYYSDDSRMEAAYYLSLCPIDALGEVVESITDLLRLPADSEEMNGNISFHLLRCVERLTHEAAFAPSSELRELMKRHES